MFLTRREPGVPLSLFRSYPLPFSPPFLLYCSLPFLFFYVFFIDLYLLQFPGRHSICCFPHCSHMFLTRREPGVPLSLFRSYPLPFSPPFLLYCSLPFLFFYVFFVDLIPEDVFILCIGFLPIPGDVFEAEIIDSVFYVSHRDYRRKFRSQTSDNMDRWKAE